MTANPVHLHIAVNNAVQERTALSDRLEAIHRLGGLDAVAAALPHATVVFHDDGTKTVTPWAAVYIISPPVW